MRKDVLQLYETKHCLLSKEHFVYYIGMLAKTEIHISVEEQKPISLDSQPVHQSIDTKLQRGKHNFFRAHGNVARNVSKR